MKLPKGPALSPRQRRISFWKMFFSPLSTMEESYSKYGDVFCTNTNAKHPFIYFCHPKAIQEIFTVDPETFQTNKIHNGEYLVGKESLILKDGARSPPSSTKIINATFS